MKNKNLTIILFTVILAAFVLFLFIYSPNTENKFIIADIKVKLNGKIKNKVAVRENLITHAKIERIGKKDTLIFLGERIDSINVGDNIKKLENSPFFYILKKGEKPKKYIYVVIPKTVLNDKAFPTTWKDSCRGNWKSAIK